MRVLLCVLFLDCLVRLLANRQLAAAADLFLKSGGDADPSAGGLLRALMESGTSAGGQFFIGLEVGDTNTRCIYIYTYGSRR